MSCEGGLSLTLERLAQGAARPADNVDLLKTLVTRIHARLKLQGQSTLLVSVWVSFFLCRSSLYIVRLTTFIFYLFYSIYSIYRYM